MMQVGGVHTVSNQEEAYLCKSMAIETGGVSQCFSKYRSQGWFDSPVFCNHYTTQSINSCDPLTPPPRRND